MSIDPYTALVVALRNNSRDQLQEGLSGVALELGTITSSGLKLDRFKYEINDYMTAEFPGRLCMPKLELAGRTDLLEDSAGSRFRGQGQFSFEPSETEDASFLVQYKPGDRVLVIPLEGGHEALVICKVVGRSG